MYLELYLDLQHGAFFRPVLAATRVPLFIPLYLLSVYTYKKLIASPKITPNQQTSITFTESDIQSAISKPELHINALAFQFARNVSNRHLPSSDENMAQNNLS